MTDLLAFVGFIALVVLACAAVTFLIDLCFEVHRLKRRVTELENKKVRK